MKLRNLICAFVFYIASAETATDCFQESKRLYGDESVGDRYSDIDLLLTLGKDHVLTKVEGCSDNRGRVASVQVTYGLW